MVELLALAGDFLYALRWLFTAIAFLILTMAYIEQGNRLRASVLELPATTRERDQYRALARHRRDVGRIIAPERRRPIQRTDYTWPTS